jgi:hypothetical protein
MNDPLGPELPELPDPPEVAPEEELASALADGEAGDAEAARATEPEVARALAMHRQVARLVAGPVEPPSEDDRERAIAAALAAFDEAPAELAAPAAGDELAARRARKRLPAWVAAVAAALVVLAGLGLLATLASDDGTTDERATSAADENATTTLAAGAETSSAAEAPTAAGGFDSASGAGGGTARSGALPYLGEFADRDDLVAIARRDLVLQEGAADSTLAPPGPESPEALLAVPCADAVGAAPGRSVLGTATVDGALVTVVVDTAADGTRTMVVFAEPACEPDRTPLEP